jgi:hypothetical protein
LAQPGRQQHVTALYVLAEVLRGVTRHIVHGPRPLQIRPTVTARPHIADVSDIAEDQVTCIQQHVQMRPTVLVELEPDHVLDPMTQPLSKTVGECAEVLRGTVARHNV